MAATARPDSVNCEQPELHLVLERKPDPLKPGEKMLSSCDGWFHSSPGVLVYSSVWGGGEVVPKGIKQGERLGCNASLVLNSFKNKCFWAWVLISGDNYVCII